MRVLHEGCNCRGLGPTRVVLSACIDPKTLTISLTDRREFRLPPALYASFYTIVPCKRQNWHHAEAQLRDLIESMNKDVKLTDSKDGLDLFCYIKCSVSDSNLLKIAIIGLCIESQKTNP